MCLSLLNHFISLPDACHNKECPFLHIDPESKIRDCPWYDRGFCRHGPLCRHRHVRRVLCLNYLAGFCSKGPECPDTHPKFELPPLGGPDDPRGFGKKIIITCHYCGEPGHKVDTYLLYIASNSNRKYRFRILFLKTFFNAIS